MASRSRARTVFGYGSQATAGTRGRQNQDEAEEEADGAQVISDNNDMLINTAVRYVLLHENQTKTISRLEIQKFLTDQHMVDKEALGLIMDELKKRIDDLFGYKMVEISPNTYILYSRYTISEVNLDQQEELKSKYGEKDLIDEPDVPAVTTGRRTRAGRRGRQAISSSDEEENDEIAEEEEEEPPLNLDDESDAVNYANVDIPHDQILEHSRRSLLMIVLSLLYMNEDPMTETGLIDALKDFGLAEEYKIDSSHDSTTKTTLKKLVLEEFKHQNYLKRNKVLSQDPDVPSHYSITWGLRAWIEFKPTDIVQFVKNIYGQPDSVIWMKMEERLRKDEKKRDALLNGGFEAFNKLSGEKTRYLDQMLSNPEATTNGTSGGGSGSGQRRARGRKKRGSDAVDEENEIDIMEQQMNQSLNPPSTSNGTASRGRGRPKKKCPPASDESEPEEVEEAPQRRSRGRPRKDSVPSNPSKGRKKQPTQSRNDDDEEDEEEQVIIRRSSGRNRSRN